MFMQIAERASCGEEYRRTQTPIREQIFWWTSEMMAAI